MPETRVYTIASQPSRFDVVIEAIAKTEKIMVLCGPGVSFDSGTPYSSQIFDFSAGGFTSRASLPAMIDECTMLNCNDNSLARDKLAAYNKTMALLRIKSRTSNPGAFLRYFQRAFVDKRVVKLLTTSFDALEVSKKRAAESKVVRLLGDNRMLRCCAPGCPGVKEQDVCQFDAPLLSGQVIPCRHCVEIVGTGDGARRVLNNQSLRYLRPTVQSRFSVQMLAGGKHRDRILKAAQKCDLLLIAGISLQQEEIMDLVYDIAEQVHGRYGGVVYISNQPIKGRTTRFCIDFHLQMDANECAELIMGKMDEIEALPTGTELESNSDHERSDLWFQIINNDLEPAFSKEVSEDTVPLCYLCNMGIEECLLRCKQCGDYLCYTGPYEQNRTRQCVLLQNFVPEASRTAVEVQIENFTCPHCWSHSQEGPYPHLVRAAQTLSFRERGQPPPRMAMIIYFLDQFWPQAKHLREYVHGQWNSRGWPCYIYPVRLEDVSEQQGILEDMDWGDKTYDLYIIYITHGLSESKTYQISHNSSYSAPELIDHTLAPAERVTSRARRRLAVFVCCGYPFESPQKVWDLQQWLNRKGTADAIVGCMNKKLTPAFLVILIGKLTTSLVREELDPRRILNCWLSDGVACNHTDLIYLERGTPPLLWLFSPFRERPLGKTLPPLLASCSCHRRRTLGDEGSKLNRKIWRVSHDAKHEKPLADITVKVKCTVCRQMWILPSEHLSGHMYKYAGLYAAVVPYFAT